MIGWDQASALDDRVSRLPVRAAAGETSAMGVTAGRDRHPMEHTEAVAWSSAPRNRVLRVRALATRVRPKRIPCATAGFCARPASVCSGLTFRRGNHAPVGRFPPELDGRFGVRLFIQLRGVGFALLRNPLPDHTRLSGRRRALVARRRRPTTPGPGGLIPLAAQRRRAPDRLPRHSMTGGPAHRHGRMRAVQARKRRSRKGSPFKRRIQPAAGIPTQETTYG